MTGMARLIRIATLPLAILWRVGKWLLAIVATVLLLCVAALVAGYLWLQTEPGQVWLGGKAGEFLTSRFSGRFTLARALVSLRSGITLVDARVEDDAGAEVVSFDRFRFDFTWSPLLHRQVVITEITLERPHVHVTQERAGPGGTTFNVARVFRPRNPTPEPPKQDDGEPFELPVDVTVRSLRVVDATARVRLQGVDPRFAALDTDKITLDADADLGRGERVLRYHVLLAGARSGQLQATGSLAFAEGLAGLTGARGDLRITALEPTTMAGAQLERSFQATISAFAKYDWVSGAAFPTADVRGLSVRTVAGTVEGRGTIDPSGGLDARVGSSRVDLAKVPWGLVRKGLSVRGVTTLDAQVGGTVRSPSGRAVVSACDVKVDGPEVPVQVRGRPSCLTADARLAPSGVVADLRGHAVTIPLHARATIEGNVLTAKDPAALPLEATLEIARMPLAIVGGVAQVPQLAAMPGTAELAVRVRGTGKRPRIYWNLDAARVTWDRFQDVDLFTSGSIIDLGTHVELVAKQKGGKVAEVRLRVVPDPARPFAHVLPGLPFSKEEALASRVEADIDLQGFALPVDGGARRAVEGYALLRYHDRGVSVVSSLSMTEAGGAPFGVANLSAAADVGPALENPAAWKEILVAAQLEADMPDMRPLGVLIPQVESIDGAFTARVSAQGKLRKPLVGARIVLDDVDITPTSGPSLEDLNVDIAGTEDRVDIRNVSLNRGGVISAKGTLDGLFPFAPRFKFEAGTNDLRVMPLTAGSPTLDAQLRVEGQLRDGVLNATARIPEIRAYIPDLAGARGRTAQSMEPHPDVVVYEGGKRVSQSTEVAQGEQPEADARTPLLREAHVRVLMPKDAWIQGPDVQLELQANLQADWVGNEVSLDGTAGLNRPGFVQVLGKRFDLATAQVEWQDADPTAGEITVEATHTADDVNVIVDVGGPVAKPEVELRSEPELSQFEIASLLVTGKTAETRAAQAEEEEGEEAGAGDRVASAAANAVGSMLAKQLLGVFARNTDLVVSVDVEDARAGQAKVGVGRYLTDRLFVSFDKRFGAGEEEASNANEVRFDYRLSRQWSVEGNYGDGREGGVDLLWKRRF